jgi:hypothetical protein
MRTIPIFMLVLVFAAAVPPVSADIVANCPLSYVGGSPSAAAFGQSPHGVFRNGSVMYVLRGQTLTTFNISDVGNVDPVREDFLSTMQARDVRGGVAFSNGYLFTSSEAGLEIFDLRNTRAGGTAPVLVSRTPGLNFRQIAVGNSVLAGTYPISDMECLPQIPGSPHPPTPRCTNTLYLFNISDLTNPVAASQIPSNAPFYGFDDVVFANGFLYVTGVGGTWGFDVTNPGAPTAVGVAALPGRFLASNGTSLLAIGQEKQIGIFRVGPTGGLSPVVGYTLPTIVDRANELMFQPDAWIDDARLITMIDEKNPMTGRSARTIAFDVFDFTVPLWNGFSDRIYENLTLTFPDERKYNPIAIGPYIYVNGELSGMQVWGTCGSFAGRIDFDSVNGMSCGGSQVRGWITGTAAITRIEVFLGSTSLGTATITGPRHGISSRTPVYQWVVNVNLDDTPQGMQTLRAVATDGGGNQRQFASQDAFFPGPGSNCTTRRRTTVRP